MAARQQRLPRFLVIGLLFVFLVCSSNLFTSGSSAAVQSCSDSTQCDQADTSGRSRPRRSLSDLDALQADHEASNELQVDEDDKDILDGELDVDVNDLDIPRGKGIADLLNNAKARGFGETETTVRTAKPVAYSPPSVDGLLHAELFDGDVFQRWVVSKDDKFTGRWETALRKNEALIGDYALRTKDVARHHAISSLLDKPLDNNLGKALVVSYEVQFHEDHNCGGAYLKLFNTNALPSNDLAQFNGETPYVIMFGPDVCGSTKKVHTIIRQKNPVTQEWHEHHLSPAPPFPLDNKTHVYTLALFPNNTFSVSVDGKVVSSGDMQTNFVPPFTPPKEIDDPTDVKPDDWVDQATIPDPSAQKPDDWDEDAPPMIPDPEAKIPEGWLENEEKVIPDPNAIKPESWNDEEDGEWVASTIPNPVCNEPTVPGCGPWVAPKIRNPAARGKWVPPMVPNPEYKGEWEARKIPNPHYFESKNPHAVFSINAAGFELWTMQNETLFDNIVFSRSVAPVNEFIDKTWKIRHSIEGETVTKEKTTTTTGDQQQGQESFVTKLQSLLSVHPMPLIGALIAPVILLISRTLSRNRVEPAQSVPETPTASEPSSKQTQPEDADKIQEDTAELAKETTTTENVPRKRGAAKKD